MKKSVVGLFTAIALFMGVASTASAIAYNGSKYGQRTVTSGTKLSITDNAADDRFPSVHYRYAGGTKEDAVANKHGYKSTVTIYAPSTITAIKPCISRPFPLPMDCGGWIY